MSQPLFKLRKELSLPVSEDVSMIDELSSYAATMDSSAPDVSLTNRYSNELLLTENSKFIVTQLAPRLSLLPSELDGLNGCVDTYSGNALCNDSDNLYIWPFKSSQKRPNFIRIALHEQHETLSSPPKCCFTWPSTGDDNDQTKSAGILIINRQSGIVRFYEDVSTINSVSTLISKKREINLDLKFKQQENVVDIVNAEPSGVLVSTTFGRLLLITIRDSSGKPCLQLKSHLVKSQVGIFTSMNSFKEIVSIRPGPITGKGERLLYSITRGGEFKIWNVSATMNSYNRVDVNVYQQILDSLQELYPFAYGTLQILDSHPLPQDPSAHLILASISDSKFTYYICTTIQVEESTNSFSIFSVYRLNTYVLPSAKKPQLFIPGALNHAGDLTADTTPVYFLFEDAIVFIQISSKLDSDYQLRYRCEDIINFRKDTKIIGYGYDTKALYLINGSNAVIKIETKLENISTATNTKFIKSHLDQAVYFSQIAESPIDFNLPENIELEREAIEEDLLESATEILLSNCNYIPPKMSSLTHHLQLRVEFFTNLLHYTQYNFIYKVSPQVKLQLVENYEILNCALALLISLEDYPEFADLWQKTLVAQGIDEEKLILTQLNKFPQVIGKFLESLNDRLGASEDITLKAAAARFVNAVIYQACLQEGENKYRYGSLNMAITEVNDNLLWIAQHSIPKNINGILFHLAFCTEDDSFRETYSIEILDCIKTLYYLCKQTDICYKEKNVSVSSPGYRSAIDFYSSNHLAWIQLLCKVNRSADAIQIADFYHDLEGLVEALNTFDKRKAEPVYEQFFSKYEYDFAKTVFTSSIEHKKIDDLFFQFEQYSAYLNRFFEENPEYGYVSWIGNIFDGKYKQASEVLTAVATSNSHPEFDLNQRQVQLSIAKLSAIVEDGDLDLDKLSNIQAHLDLMEFQKKLADILKNEAKISPRYQTMKGFSKYYSDLEEKVNNNRSISLPELINLYTAIQNPDVFYQSLKLLALEKSLSPNDKHSLISMVWRRCILIDSWDDQSNDMETAFYHTLLRFFNDRLFIDGIELPDVDRLRADDSNSSAIRLLEDPQLQKLCKKDFQSEIKALQNLSTSLKSRMQSLIGSANVESGAKCVINYETNSID
ncbi:HEL054Cp [Eremothecium sinecaudum]|uniref:HEL054Cp n=1 Tax=Eremothecium sinecaudum TaxID=45286 RepID=A0A120K2D7_9SACH|nr:HEL054Cp [Eremothecium sinecaudum]AMD21226.1 HEL054Cp [Eremothecium sinecaudum]